MSGNKLNNEQKKHISGYTSALSIALIVGLVFESESILAVSLGASLAAFLFIYSVFLKKEVE